MGKVHNEISLLNWQRFTFPGTAWHITVGDIALQEAGVDQFFQTQTEFTEWRPTQFLMRAVANI